MPERNGQVSMTQKVADHDRQLRRLRIPTRIHPYTRTGPISAAVAGTAPLHNDSGTVLGVSSVRVTLGTAPSTQPVIVDVTANGTSIFTGGLPQVAVGATVGDPVVPDAGQWLPGAALYVNVTQGDDTAVDLHVTIAVA